MSGARTKREVVDRALRDMIARAKRPRIRDLWGIAAEGGFYEDYDPKAASPEDFGKYHSYLGRKQEPGPSGDFMGDNWANFIAAVRSGKHSDLNAPIEEGAISTALVHLANISYRVGRTLHFDAATYSCTGDEEANKMFRREYRKPFVVPETV